MICFLIISLLAAASAQTYKGQCPNVHLVKNFNPTAYLGKWHEVFVTPAPATGFSCVQYEVIQKGDTFVISRSYVYNGNRTKAETTLGPIKANNNRTQSPQTLAERLSSLGDLVVATDYTTYGIEYQCYYDNLTDTHAYLVLVGLRSLQVHDEVKTKINDFFKTNIPDLDLSKFTQVDFSEEACKYTNSETILYSPPTDDGVVVL